MAPIVPTYVPSSFVAGDTVSFDIADFADYPISEGYALTYSFRFIAGEPGGTGDLSLDIGASAITQNGSTHEVRLTAAVTAPLRAGTWRWVAYCTAGAARYTADSGTVTITADYATLEATTSHAERELVAVEAAILQLVENNVASYSLNGRSVTKLDLAALQARRGVLLSIIWREQNPGQLYPVARVAFGPAR